MSTANAGAGAGAGPEPRRRIVFLHQSTGAEILRDGDVRGLLRQRMPALELWDYGFNPPSLAGRLRGLARRPRLMPPYYYGLGDGAGRRTAARFHVADTGPDGLALMFAQPATTPAGNALSHLLAFDGIAFKSCFTIFPIADEAQLRRYQQKYGVVRDVMARHPARLFLPLTPPPLRASLCTPQQAALARRFADWIMSEEFTGGLANVRPFDLFDLLAQGETEAGAHTLRPEYCLPDLNDSHPNEAANGVVADRWATFLADAARQFWQPSRSLVAR